MTVRQRFQGPEGLSRLVSIRALRTEKQRPIPPSKEVWQAAINRNADLASGEKVELQAFTGLLPGDIPLGQPNDKVSIQRTDLKGLSMVQVGLASFEQLLAGGSIFSNPTTWNLLLDIVQGDKGVNFPLRTVNVPIIGCVVATRGDSVYATLRNASGLPAPIEVSCAISQEQETPSPVRRSRLSNLRVGIPFYATHYTYVINGGVTLGDTQQEFDTSGALLTSYPAREGASIPINELALTVGYTISAGVPRFITWYFWTEK